MRKLNLGSGGDYRDGWVNVDYDRKATADKYFDLRENFPLDDSSFDFILAQDVLEHMTKEHGRVFLSECWRVLKIGGYIEIRVPNVFEIFDKFGRDTPVMMKFLYGDTRRGELGAHKYGYDRKIITDALVLEGFSVDEIVNEETNLLVKAKKIKKNIPKIKLLISGQDSGGLGGAENFLLNLAKGLSREGVSLEFTVARGSKFGALVDGLGMKKKEILFRMDVIGDIKGFIKFFLVLPITLYQDVRALRGFKKRGGNMVLLPGISDKILISPLAYLLGIRIIWTEFAPLGEVLKKNFGIPKVLYRLVNKLPDQVIVPSENTRIAILRERVSDAKIEKIYCGIDLFSTAKIREIRNKAKIVRREMGLENHFMVGVISRIEKEKGQDMLIGAAGILRAKINSLKVLIVGEGETAELTSLVEEKKLQDIVQFLGYVPDQFEALGMFDVFVFPTRWNLEGFGIAPIEAMMMGVPVVASNHGPVPEIMEDGAVIVNPDAEGIAEGIMSLYKNLNLRNKLIAKGSARAKMFDINSVASEYKKLLEEVLVKAK